MIYFVPVLIAKTRLRGRILQYFNLNLIKRGFTRIYTTWTEHGEIDDTILEVECNEYDSGDDDDDDSEFEGYCVTSNHMC